METIRPDQIPDRDVVGQEPGTQPDLAEREFVIRCPPDVQPKTRIVAICGATDYEDDAGPDESGRFFSDFYLFFHLLQPDGSDSNTVPTRQQWFTCEQPRRLIEKYTEYAHGCPKSERRVVLEAPLLQDIENSGRLYVTDRQHLLERFQSALREQSRLAVANDEPLLILIFGHGEVDKYGVAIGGEAELKSCPKLLIDDVKSAIDPAAQMTLLMTSCYSGGWLVRPDLNITNVASTAPDRRSFSWPRSSAIGRASRSRVASSILQTLAKPVANTDLYNNPAYMHLSECIWDTLEGIDPLAGYPKMEFSAEDDEWEMAYHTRSGLPLLSYQNRWESLRLLPHGSLGNGSMLEPPGTIVDPFLPRVGSITVGLKRYALQNLAREYLDSFPGFDEAGPNGPLHRRLRRFLKNPEVLDHDQVERSLRQVSYRLDAMREADRIRAFMNLKFPSIFEIDVYKWISEHPLHNVGVDSLVDQLLHLVISKELFDDPVDSGLAYPKPWKYLAIALIDSGLEWDEIETVVDAAVRHKGELTSAIFRRYRSVIDRTPEIWALQSKLMEFAGRT